jgi:hypothetical protein
MHQDLFIFFIYQKIILPFIPLDNNKKHDKKPKTKKNKKPSQQV